MEWLFHREKSFLTFSKFNIQPPLTEFAHADQVLSTITMKKTIRKRYKMFLSLSVQRHTRTLPILPTLEKLSVAFLTKRSILSEKSVKRGPITEHM